MMLNDARRRNASSTSSLFVANSDGENCASSASSCSRVGEITMSMSFVARGTPCAELANDPVTKYGIPAASRAARNFSKTSFVLNASYRCRIPTREMFGQLHVPKIPDDGGESQQMWSPVQRH